MKSAWIIFLGCTLSLQLHSQSFQWAAQVTGLEYETITDIVTDASGNIYVVGGFKGTIVLGSTTYTSNGTDIFLAKYNSSGVFQWGKAIPDTGSTVGDDWGTSIALDGSNNVYIAGRYNYLKNFNPGGSGGASADLNSEGFIAKYSSTGTFQWLNSVRYAYFNAVSFSSSQSKIYGAGTLQNITNIDFDPGAGTLYLNGNTHTSFIASYNLSGASPAAKNFGGNSELNNMAVDPSGNVYVTGQIIGTGANFNPSGSSTSFDASNGGMFIGKYTSGISYTSAIQVSGSSGDRGITVEAPANDQIYYGGTVDGDLYIARRNSSFALSWEKLLGSNGAVRAIAIDGSNVFFSADVESPYTSVNIGNGVVLSGITSGDVSLFKINSSGTGQWATRIDLSNGGSHSMATSGSNFIVAGYFTNTADFNACFNTTTYTATSSDSFLAKYSGNLWSSGVGPINGASVLCSTNQTYTIPNLPAGCTVNWTVSPASLFAVDTGTGSSFTTRTTSSSIYGNGTITATISGDCGNLILNKSIWGGKANSSLIEYFATNVSDVEGQAIKACDYTSADAGYDGGSGASVGIYEYEWDIPYSSSWDIYEEYGGPIEMRYVEIEYYEDPPPSTETIKIRAINTCGTSNWKSIVVDVEDNCSFFTFSMSPNPVDQTLTLDFSLSESSSVQSKSMETSKVNVVEVIIYDGNQMVMLSQNGSTDRNMELDVSALMPGTYYIHLVSDGEVVSKKHLIVK